MSDRGSYSSDSIVLIIAVADTVDELIELANASDYSLTSAVWSRDLTVAMDVAGRIHASKLNLPFLIS